MSDRTTTVLLCGVGGQGTILAAHLLASVALGSGLDAKVSEIHGMAQRGGAVTVVSFELIEALRNLPFLAPEGTMVASDEVIEPTSVACGRAPLPPRMRQALEGHGALLVPADALAREAGNPKASNVALLGALSASLGFPAEAWERAVEASVPPKTVDVNLRALAAGRGFALAAQGR